MSIYTFGLNHTTAPLDVRERVTFAPDALADALRELTGARKVKEVAILSTCNRTEVYFHGGAPEPVARWLEGVHRLPDGALAPYTYTLARDKSVAHAFRVASGLDSMVLGEPQILGQMKQAVRTAESAGSLGLVLNRLFQRTFAVAKDVRTRTDIGAASISMAAAAVKLAERIFPSISEQRLLLIGAGEMIELAATHFAAKKPRTITVSNRTMERGQKLADRFGAEAITLNEIPDRLHQFDIVVTCTASSLPIIGKGLLERVIKQRRHRPIFIVDLAVPRDVEAEAGKLDDVFLYSVDDLAEIVKGNLQVRREAVVQAEEMIATQEDNWTLAVLVPDQMGKREAMQCGFPKDNIAVWDATSTQGLEEAGQVIREATEKFMVGRAQGMVSLNDALSELVKKGLVTPEEAILRAVDKAGLEMLLKRR